MASLSLFALTFTRRCQSPFFPDVILTSQLAHQLNGPIAITHLSQTISRFIDTGMEIRMLALTGNVLLVLDSDGLVAWRLTEEGAVDGVLADRRAGRGDSIWAVSARDPRPDVLG